MENKHSGSHIAYTSALKNDLLSNPDLVEKESKENFYKLLEWLQDLITPNEHAKK
ncbi:hypothetical protein [Helicobacter cetorum]|uniref:hypothetical protein n=1 Tax=Helicobacter cetorum TaxID=138563 RepID=UPI00031FC642|nr:hypothetical protein [Helicobacter cetorum]